MTRRKRPEDCLPPGQPTKWKPEYNQMIIDFFSISPYRESENIDGERILIPNEMPFLIDFAMKIGVDTDTLGEWAKEENKEKYPGFSGAYRKSKVLQERFLAANGLLKMYDARFTMFFMKNVCGWKDSQDLNHSGEIKGEPRRIIIVKDEDTHTDGK